MLMPTLMIVIASTRAGGTVQAVGDWFHAHAREHGRFEIDLVDLAELDLPMVDEPHHPRLREYTKRHTREWSVRVDAADAFVFVTPEYNHGFNAPLKNAIDYLHHEWKHKPLGFVSYGGVAAGTRAVQMLKQVAAALNLVPATTAVAIPFVRQFLDDDGRVTPNDTMDEAARALLDELERLEPALRELRLSAAATRLA
jgi:NAD(P)H-dependent FMN reductase